MGLRAAKFDLMMRIQIESSATLGSRHETTLTPVRTGLSGKQILEDKSLNPNKKTGPVNGSFFYVSLLLVIGLNDRSHPWQASTVSLNCDPRPVFLISPLRDTFEYVNFMVSINYSSRCCDKNTLTKHNLRETEFILAHSSG